MAQAISHEHLGALNAAYAACIDEDRLESWSDFFTDQCLYMVTTAENYRQGLPAGLIYADSKGMLRDRISALREANIYERQHYRHIVSMSRIVGSEADGTLVETSFLVVRIMRGGKTDLFATGKYVDTVTTDGQGELKLARRIAVCDSISIDTLLAIPL
jgi:3-phenylpropionate/cinnamic acid dioxygenase small subunit